MTPTAPDLTALFGDIRAAHQALRPSVMTTPLTLSPGLSALCGAQVYLKCEHLQHTGSFKFRGASNTVRLLDAQQRQRGVITASSGNHGQGLALAARQAGVPLTVYAAAQASAMKLDAIRALGAQVITVAADPLSVELRAAAAAEAEGRVFVSPYNNPQVVAGQGTVGMELHEQLPGLDAVFVAVGGGGLVSGIGTALKHLDPGTQIIGCWPENAPAMQRSLAAGSIIEVAEHPTLSDGTAGGVEPGSITFALCQQVIDRTVLVSERAIAQAMRAVAQHERWIIEGAAGVAVAAALQVAGAFQGKRLAVVVCGRNIVLEKYLEAIA